MYVKIALGLLTMYFLNDKYKIPEYISTVWKKTRQYIEERSLRLDEETNEIQFKLFHMPKINEKNNNKQSKQYSICHGINKWHSSNYPTRYFGFGNGLDLALPPYDMSGVKKLRIILKEKFDIDVVYNDYKVNHSPPALYVGGEKTNPESKKIFDYHSSVCHLPYQFTNKEKISPDLLEKDLQQKEIIPPKIYRVYVDGEDERYEKKSDTNRCLTKSIKISDNNYEIKKVFGPKVTPEGKIKEDVILLSNVPGPNGEPVTLLVDGYGSAARTADILCDYNILKEIYKEVIDESTYWFQAVFTIPVKYKNEIEWYGKPKFVEMKPLGPINPPPRVSLYQ